jgi:2,3,4,5-tetrahydropyridine-2,6-dicarboxylate N-succinyltransferase
MPHADFADLARTVDAAWEDRTNVNPQTKGAVREAVEEALALNGRSISG